MITASVKLTAAQMATVRRDAHKKRMTISDHLRALLFPEKKPKCPQVIPKRHPVSGCWYNAAPGQANPTREEIQEALADFP